MQTQDEHKLIKAIGVGIVAAAAYMWVTEEPNKRRVQRWLSNLEEPLSDISPLVTKYFLPDEKPTDYNSLK